MGRKRLLTDAQVFAICELYHEQKTPDGRNWSMDMLARKFNVSKGTIQNAIEFTCAYKHLSIMSIDQYYKGGD